MGELSTIVMQFPYAGLFCLLILGSIGFPFPEDAILLSCGFLISRQIIMPLPAFLVVYTGIMIGDFIIYSFGKKYGRALVTHDRFRRLLPPDRLDFIEGRFRKFGVLAVLAGRQIIGVRAQTLLAAGALRMPLRTFLLTDAFASCLTITIMVWLGFTGTRNIIRVHYTGIQWEHVLMVVLPVAAYLIGRRFISRRRVTMNAGNDIEVEKVSC